MRSFQVRVPRMESRNFKKVLVSATLLAIGVSWISTSPSQADSPDDEDKRKDAVGSLFPFPMSTAEDRETAAFRYGEMLRRSFVSYVYEEIVEDPLEQFRASGDRSKIPSPTSGGRGNNANDRLTNRILGWLLFDDDVALESALNISDWLAEALDRQDHGHVQRHPSLALAALATSDEVQKERLLSAFLSSFHTLQVSRFWRPENWQVGLSGVRPFFRAVGAAHRFSYHFDKLRELGEITDEQIASYDFPFASTSDLLDLVGERLAEFLSWRKVLGDDEPRGWQTDPGGWRPGSAVTFWPYLDSREPSGRNSTWFHYGQIIPFETLVIKVFYPERFTQLIADRASEVAEWALLLGSDLTFGHSTGFNMVSRRDWFFPTNPQLQRQFRYWTEDEKDVNGENVYCLMPAVYWVRGYYEFKRTTLRGHVNSSKFSTFAGEVSFAGYLAVWQGLNDLP